MGQIGSHVLRIVSSVFKNERLPWLGASNNVKAFVLDTRVFSSSDNGDDLFDFNVMLFW